MQYFLATLFLFSVAVLSAEINLSSENPYEILGVDKTASQSEIRKAYKKLAMVYHPDKKSDEESAKTFAAVNSAYDIIGNPDKRALYDDFGKSKDGRGGFNSYWEFAQSNTKSSNDFYVGDSMITRLSSELWGQRMTGDTIWLVNFYAPWCTHCQQAIPMYKNLAGKLDGIVEVGSLNCHKDSDFCSTMGINAYPTFIMFYPKYGFQQSMVVGNGELDAQLMNFVNSRVSEWNYLAQNANLQELTDANFAAKVRESNDFWAVIFVGGMGQATTRNNSGKMAFMRLSTNLKNLANVGIINCDENVRTCVREFQKEKKLYFPSFPYFRLYSRGNAENKISREPFSLDAIGNVDLGVALMENVLRIALAGGDSCKV